MNRYHSTENPDLTLELHGKDKIRLCGIDLRKQTVIFNTPS